jgi:hypothetical protein
LIVYLHEKEDEVFLCFPTICCVFYPYLFMSKSAYLLNKKR